MESDSEHRVKSDTGGSRSWSWTRMFLCSLLLLWGVSYGLLNLGDVFESELGGHPDEASHYVTGLMVHDYVWGHLGENPLAYAELYYEFYPKVAIGHFPPGFYVIQTLWFSLFSDSLNSVLLLQSFVAGVLGAMIACLVTWGGGRRGLSILVGLVFCSLPLVQRYVGMVMSDLLLGLFCFGASWCFGIFLQKPGYRWSLLFGFLAAGTIMIKGSGLMLAFVPPIALVLTRRYELFRSREFWAATLPVLAVCLPWMLLTYKITEEGMVREWSPGYVAEALPYFAKQIYRTLGAGLCILMLIGVRASLKGRQAAGKVPEMSAVMLALPIGLILTYTLIPVGFEQRYLIPFIGPAMFFVGMGCCWVWNKSLLSEQAQWKGIPVLLCFLGLYLIEVFSVPAKGFQGFQNLVDAMDLNHDGESKKILVSSDARGEGAVVASVAMSDVRLGNRVLRGSKVLSSSDWMGRGYTLAHTNSTDLLAFFKTEEIDWLIVDLSVPMDRSMGHHGQVARLVQDFPMEFERAGQSTILRRFKGSQNLASVYRVRPHQRNARNGESE